jgi:hypothetical protein
VFGVSFVKQFPKQGRNLIVIALRKPVMDFLVGMLKLIRYVTEDCSHHFAVLLLVFVAGNAHFLWGQGVDIDHATGIRISMHQPGFSCRRSRPA